MALRLKDHVTLYFARHGETEANVEKRFQGLTIDTPLTARGRAQAGAIAESLRRAAPEPAALACVSSPLRRARATMELVRGALNLDPRDYATDARIEEIDLGEWDGLTDGEARARDPAMFSLRGNDKWNVRVPGGENYRDVAERATDWAESLARDTFAVSHGAFTRILRGLFAGLDWRAMSELDEKQGVLFRARGSAVERFDPPPGVEDGRRGMI
ncbi:MAG TPA: histidine phosphatase family protein [Rhizomicrobium sp.]|nr:histidine phosphatase family protein [Rhizomicrobium sp.]